MNKLAPTALGIAAGGILISFLTGSGVAFVVGVLLGFILSLVALGQIKRRNERGEGYGIAALTLSTLGIVFLIVAIITIATWSSIY